MELDRIDLKIIEILQRDGRITNSELSRQIGISPPPTLERVRKLERNGVIRRYVALVEPLSVGIETFTFVAVTLTRHGRDAVTAFLEAVEVHPEILECHHITGDSDFLLKIAVRNFPAYEHFVLQTLTDLPFIQNLNTMVVLSTTKNETVLPIIREEPDGS
ncbi:MAG: Lrp/AsnC family transcriptional regulator [Candidatus Delongbacteria bacterium]|nr:Lrp/AsnC family transcriptional regulator [Candidatus Delongbacteria bacterium]